MEVDPLCCLVVDPPPKKKYGKPTVSASGRYHKNRLVAAGRSTGDGAQLEIRQQSHLAARITPMKVEFKVASDQLNQLWHLLVDIYPTTRIG